VARLKPKLGRNSYGYSGSRKVEPVLQERSLVLWFDGAVADIPLVGGKNASLELIQLAPRGISVPEWIWTTSYAYGTSSSIWVRRSCDRYCLT